MKVSNTKYHFLLLGGAAFVFIYNLIIGSPAVDIQMETGVISYGPMRFGLLIVSVILIKALAYYLTRTYPMFALLCMFDIVFTLVLAFILIYFSRDQIIGNDLSQDGGIFWAMTLAFWVLVQLFVAVNYLILMFFGKR